MNRDLRSGWIISCCLICTLGARAAAQEPSAEKPSAEKPSAEKPSGSADEQAIRAAIQSYVDAFNKQDAKAVASHWTETGEFITPGGSELKGREAIQKEFEGYFADGEGATVEVAETEIRFLSPGVAAEEGTALVLRPDETPDETAYVAIHVKTTDGWKMDSVREQAQVRPQSHYDQLKQLEWMIGEWVDADDEVAIETSCRWTKNNNFILRSFKVVAEDRIDLEGSQIIGWDPAANTIRSWMFDSEGGFGVGAWTRNGDRWTVRTLQVLASGERASAINVMTYVDDDTFTIRSTSREVDGEIMPGIPETRVVRN
jgi:uncharacterized protein (TIGR02246 family)